MTVLSSLSSLICCNHKSESRFCFLSLRSCQNVISALMSSDIMPVSFGGTLPSLTATPAETRWKKPFASDCAKYLFLTTTWNSDSDQPNVYKKINQKILLLPKISWTVKTAITVSKTASLKGTAHAQMQSERFGHYLLTLMPILVLSCNIKKKKFKLLFTEIFPSSELFTIESHWVELIQSDL